MPFEDAQGLGHKFVGARHRTGFAGTLGHPGEQLCGLPQSDGRQRLS